MSTAYRFCRIASGQVPTHRVYASERVPAFLDSQPTATQEPHR
ncbi:hypothetical protein [Pseudomonas cavernae]|nr:hypothetical protein [Pseudomonas cavernae]